MTARSGVHKTLRYALHIRKTPEPNEERIKIRKIHAVADQTLFFTTLQRPATPDIKVAAAIAGLTPASNRRIRRNLNADGRETYQWT